jgi:ribosomal protein S6--L-glutamate ligase
MKAAIVSQGSISSKMLAEAMQKHFETVDMINVKGIEISLGGKEALVLYNGKPFGKYDCIYAKGSFRYADLLRSFATAMANKCYMPMKARAFTEGHDKLLTYLRLQAAKVPTAKSYITASTSAAKEVIKEMRFPVVMKFPHGTHGKGVMFADSYESASSMLDALSVLNQPFIIQEYIETGGVDTRVIVAGDQVVAAMQREAVQGEKRANIHAGGKGVPITLDTHTKKIAIETAKAIGAEICAVDILIGIKGPVVIEANVSPGLQGITKYTKINVAEKLAKFMYDKTLQFKQQENLATADLLKEAGVKDASEPHEIIVNLDFRGERILLPEIITRITKLTERDEVAIKVDKGRLFVEKSDLAKEEKKKKNLVK